LLPTGSPPASGGLGFPDCLRHARRLKLSAAQAEAFLHQQTDENAKAYRPCIRWRCAFVYSLNGQRLVLQVRSVAVSSCIIMYSVHASHFFAKLVEASSAKARDTLQLASFPMCILID